MFPTVKILSWLNLLLSFFVGAATTSDAPSGLPITSDGSSRLFSSIDRVRALSLEHRSSTSMLALQVSSIDHQGSSIKHCNAINSISCKIDS